MQSSCTRSSSGGKASKMTRDSSIKQYIAGVKQHLARHFAPSGIYHGEKGARRLAREIGYGLADWTDAEIQKAMPGLYSDLLIRFTFNTASGVPLDKSDWDAEIHAGIQKSRTYPDVE
jgi:hypothetical protein